MIELEEPQWIVDSYDLHGWAADFSYPNNIGFDAHFALYNEMVVWIKTNVERYEHNALWTKIGDCIYVKLRKKNDALMFALKFGL